MDEVRRTKIIYMRAWNDTLVDMIMEKKDVLKAEYLATLFFFPADFRRVDPEYVRNLNV